MGLLTFSLNLTLDGCVDHQEGIADDETHAFFTRLMDEGGAMLWGRVTYEMMESYWPAVARGDEEAPPAMREWAVKLEAKPKYVVSSTRKDFPWTTATTSPAMCARACRSSRMRPPPACSSAAASSRPSLHRLDLIDEYKLPGSFQDRRPRPDAVPRRAARHAPPRAALGEAAPQRRGGHALPPRALNDWTPIAR